MKDHVVIKGSKYGLAVYLDDSVPFDELLEEIESKFRAAARFFEGGEMAVSLENRILTKEQERRIVDAISGSAGIQILCILDHDERNEKIYRSAVEQTQAEMPGQDGRFYRGTLKRNHVLESEASIVIVGDVEEGATVVSKGSIVVIGALLGSAQAGASGRTDVFVAALHMSPEKLRIGGRKVKPVIGGSYSWAKLS